MGKVDFIEYPKVMNSEVATAAFTSAVFDCRGMACLRAVGTPVGLVDAGGIDQDIVLQGSVNGSLWTDIIDPLITFTAIATEIQSALVDIRCYSLLRVVYDQKGATAGTISLWVNLLPINDA